jgi:hypothetical protein
MSLGVVHYNGMTKFSGGAALECNDGTLYQTTVGLLPGSLYTPVVCMVVDGVYNWYEYGGNDNPPVGQSVRSHLVHLQIDREVVNMYDDEVGYLSFIQAFNIVLVNAGTDTSLDAFFNVSRGQRRIRHHAGLDQHV